MSFEWISKRQPGRLLSANDSDKQLSMTVGEMGVCALPLTSFECR
jgi:hypothetical protein